MKLVAIESPLGAASRAQIEANKHYARSCLKDSLSRGEAPFASHLLYDQPGIYDDLVPNERSQGITAGLAWTSQAQLCAVYVDFGISTGMRMGIQSAERRRIPIEYRAFTHAGRAIIAEIEKNEPKLNFNAKT